MSIIVWDDKVSLREQGELGREYQVTADDLNTLKNAVNQLWDAAHFTEVVTQTIVDSGQAFITDEFGTLLSNDADVVIDSTKGGVQPGKGNYDVAGSFFDISSISNPCQIFLNLLIAPAGAAETGVEIHYFSDKTNIPGSFIKKEVVGMNRSQSTQEAGSPLISHYDPTTQAAEAIQVFCISRAVETVILKSFSIFINPLKQ